VNYKDKRFFEDELGDSVTGWGLGLEMALWIFIRGGAEVVRIGSNL
jgi:hypothetical protein